MICVDCALERGGKARFIATTMQEVECPYCGEEKHCVSEYKYGLPDPIFLCDDNEKGR